VQFDSAFEAALDQGEAFGKFARRNLQEEISASYQPALRTQAVGRHQLLIKNPLHGIRSSQKLGLAKAPASA